MVIFTHETMMMDSQAERKAGEKGQLVSRTSILILSGFLCGISWNASMHGSLDGINACVFLMALFALLAFLGLDMTAFSRRQRAVRLAEKRSAETLKRRMSRHLLDE